MDFAGAATRHRPALLVYCRRLLYDDHAAAEDATQETLLKAWRAWATVADFPERAVVAWLYRIARNCCIDAMRRSRPTVTLLAAVAVPGGGGDVAQAVIARLEWQRVAALLDGLPPDYRRTLLLAAFGYGQCEVAAVDGVPPGTIRSRRTYARGHLRALAGVG